MDFNTLVFSYVLITTMFTGFMALIWTRKNLFNAAIKFALFVLTFFGLYLLFH